MKNYIEVERALATIPGIKTKHYRSDNFMTPDVAGFIPIARNIEAEISYGTAIGEGYVIGFTLFENNKLMPYEKREKYDRCFMDDEINEISNHVEFIKNQIKGRIVYNEN